MDLTGKITGVSNNFITGCYELTLAINEPDSLKAIYEELKGKEVIGIDLRPYPKRKRRSLDANAYFHVLVGKLADKRRLSKPYCKNLMIGRYGQPFYVDDTETVEALIKTNIPESEMMENTSVHCMACSHRWENGREVIFYRVMRGSSTYDTREMSILIDGTVQECMDQGIETLTPDELARMVATWRA